MKQEPLQAEPHSLNTWAEASPTFQGASFDMSADNSGFEQLALVISEIKERASDLSPVMDEVGSKLQSSAEDAIEGRTSPHGASWEPREPSTQAIRGGRISGRLKASLGVSLSAHGAELFSPLPYAGVQNFGNERNRFFGGMVKPIPARPFSPINRAGNLPEALEHEIGEIVLSFILENKQ